MKVAIFGGTFNPVHTAHLTVAREAAHAFAIDRVLFVVAANPPHKPAGHYAPFEDRFRMVELACAGETLFVPSRLEEGAERSYSFHTIERVRSTLQPGDAVYFIIGSDAFAEIESWYRWRDVIDRVCFIVVARPGHAFQAPEGAKVLRLDTLALLGSSTDLRKRLAAGEHPPGLPDAVYRYIVDHHLYGVQPASSQNR